MSLLTINKITFGDIEIINDSLDIDSIKNMGSSKIASLRQKLLTLTSQNSHVVRELPTRLTFTSLGFNESIAFQNGLLSKYGLTSCDLVHLKLFLTFPPNIERIHQLAKGEPIHIRKDKDNGLSRSFIYVPGKNERSAQVFVLLKDHNTPILGKGSFKTATKALGFLLNNQGVLSGPFSEKAFLSCSLENANGEIKIMPQLGGEPYCLTSLYIVKYPDKRNVSKKAGMIMDLMEGDLQKYCETHPIFKSHPIDLDRIRILRDAAEGLKEMHQLQLVHNDVKPSNIAIHADKGKIADFGLSAAKGKLPSVLAVFQPPEIHMNPLKQSLYTSKVDIFQFGLSMMVVLGYEKYVFDYIDLVKQCYFEDAYIHFLPRMATTIFQKFQRENSGPLIKLISECIDLDPKKRIDSQVLVMRLEQLLPIEKQVFINHSKRLDLNLNERFQKIENNFSHLKMLVESLASPVAASTSNNPKNIFEGVETNLSKLRKLFDDNITSPDSLPNHVNPYFISKLQLDTFENILRQNSDPQEKQTDGTKGGSIRNDRGFFVDSAGSSREILKPKTIDWNQMQFKVGIIPKDELGPERLQFGVEVPMNMNGYGVNSSVNIQADTQALKDMWVILSGKKLNPKSSIYHTPIGDYKIKWYSMGHSVVSSANNKDFKVRIQDPDKKKHTLWIRGISKLEKEINEYLNHLMSEKTNLELGNFSNRFQKLLDQKDIHSAQILLNDFWKLYKQHFSPNFYKQHQNYLDQKGVCETVEKLQTESICRVVQEIKRVPNSDTMSSKDYLKQELLNNLLLNKLLQESNNIELNTAFETLSETKKGSFANSPDLNEKVDFPTKDNFKSKGKHYRKEMFDRALKCRDQIINAYKELIVAVRDNNGVAEAEKNFRKVYEKEKNAGKHGFGIKLTDNKTLEDWFTTHYPDVVAAFNGTSTWIKELYEGAKVPYFNEEEKRSLLIAVSINDYNKSIIILNDSEAPADKRQVAFKARYEAAKNLQNLHLTQEELGNLGSDALATIIKHYEWCEGHVAFSDAARSIDKILKTFSDSKEGKTTINMHQLKDADREELRKQAEAIVNKANVNGNIYKFSLDILEEEKRSLLIAVSINDYNKSIIILNDSEAPADKRQVAFKARYEAAKNLQNLHLTQEELGSLGSDAFAAIIKHYEGCEGHITFSDAAHSIDKILKSLSETKEGKITINLHHITEANREELRKQAEVIFKKAHVNGEFYKFSLEILSYNYQVLADSYGKFGALFLTNAVIDYAHEYEYKAFSASIHIAKACFPTFLKDALVIPLAYYQGNQQVVISNMIQGIKKTKEQFTDWQKNKIRIFDTTWNIATLALPLIYDPHDIKNRLLFQNVQVLSGVVSRVQNYLSNTLKPHFFITTPFDIFEFLVEQPERPKEIGNWTWLDKSKNYVHQTLMQVMPNFLQPGNLPENQMYYAVKHFAGNVGSALAIVEGGRNLKGSQGDNRDLIASALYAISMSLWQGWRGKYIAEAGMAMYKNAEFYFKNQNYVEALPSLFNLKEYLSKNRENSLNFVKIELFALEAYYISLYQVVIQCLEKKVYSQLQFLLERMEKAVDGGFTSDIWRINQILNQNHFLPVHENAKQICSKLEVLQLNFVVLLINFFTEDQTCEASEDNTSHEQTLAQLKQSLKGYSGINIEMNQGRFKLTGVVTNADDQIEISKIILAFPGCESIEDQLKIVNS